MQVAQANLEIAYRESGHYDRRDRRAAASGSRRQPEDRDARWELGRAYAALGRHDEAIAEFEALLARSPADVPAMLQLGPGREGARPARRGQRVARARLRRGPRQRGRPLLPRRGALQPRPERAGARGARARPSRGTPTTPRRTTCWPSCTATWAGTRTAREATKRAIALNPDAGPRPGQSRARALCRGSGARGADGATPRRTARRSGRVRRARWPTTTSGWRSGRRAITTRRCASTGWRSRPARTAGSTCRRWPRCTCCAASSAAGARAVRRAGARVPGFAEALERAGRLSAPGRAARRGARLLRARGGRGPRLPARVEQPRRHPRAASRRRGGDRGVPPGARAAARPLLAARLNLGAAPPSAAPAPAGARGVSAGARRASRSAVAWNGVGLVLMELTPLRGRAECVRARGRRRRRASPAAHYNLSFVLSQLGDFDGALRETRRALELEPLYVPQKFSLTIDLQYEDPTIAIAPELIGRSRRRRARRRVRLRLAGARPTVRRAGARCRRRAAAHAVAGDALDLARDYIGKGLLDLAAAELSRAAARGAPRGATAVLLGDIFAKRGLYGEALERYREPRGPRRPTTPTPRWARSARCSRSAGPATRRRSPTSSRGGSAATSRCWWPGPGFAWRWATRSGALDCIREAQTLAPGRPDLFHLQAQVSARLGDRSAALAAFNAALQLDPSLVRVWYELGGSRRSAATGRRRAPPTSARSTCCRPTAPPRSPSPICSAAPSRPRAAVHVLVRLLEADPYELEALTALGRALLEDGRTDPGARGVHAGAAVRSGARRPRFTTRAPPRAAAAVRRRGAGVGAGHAARPARAVRRPGAEPRALGPRPPAHLRRRGGLSHGARGHRSRSCTSRTSSSCSTSAGRAGCSG